MERLFRFPPIGGLTVPVDQSVIRNSTVLRDVFNTVMRGDRGAIHIMESTKSCPEILLGYLPIEPIDRQLNPQLGNIEEVWFAFENKERIFS